MAVVDTAIWSGEPTFPVADAYAHVAEVAYWSGPIEQESALPHSAAARETIRLYGERLRSFEHHDEILPGVRALPATGHTPGHSAILLESAGERLLCVGDTFYDPLQVTNPGWATPWDLDHPASVATRRRILAWAADEQVLLHAYHLPFPGLGRVRRTATSFTWEPIR